MSEPTSDLERRMAAATSLALAVRDAVGGGEAPNLVAEYFATQVARWLSRAAGGEAAAGAAGGGAGPAGAEVAGDPRALSAALDRELLDLTDLTTSAADRLALLEAAANAARLHDLLDPATFGGAEHQATFGGAEHQATFGGAEHQATFGGAEHQATFGGAEHQVGPS